MSNAFFILKVEMQENGYALAEIQRGPNKDVYDSETAAPLRMVAQVIERLLNEIEIPGGINDLQN